MRHRAVEFWPFLVAFLTIPVQTDVLIALSATWRGWFGFGLPGAIIAVAAIATGKMLWTYWFWGWLRDLVLDTPRFQRLEALAKQAAGLVKGEGLVDRALAELKVRNDQAHSHGRKLLAMTKAAACLFLLGAGSYPMWGTRGPLLAGVGLVRFREGLYALLVANAFRVLYLMGGLALLFRHTP